MHLHIDASQEGLGYLLSHPIEEDKEDSYRIQGQLVTLGSMGLSPAQSRYSTVKLEALALVHAVNKLDNYMCYCSNFRVFLDSKNLSDYMQLNLPDIKNSRIQRMLNRLRPYAIEVTHVRVETNYLANHLSRNPRGCPEAEEFDNYTPITICNKSYPTISSTRRWTPRTTT